MLRWIDRVTRFHTWGPEANPVIGRLMRREGRPRLRVLLWPAFGLGVAGALLSARAVLLARTTHMDLLSSLLLLMGWLFTLLAPLLATVVATTLTIRNTCDDPYDLLRLTPLSEQSFVWAYVFAALVALRLVFFVLVVLMPVMVIRQVFLVLSVHVFFFDLSANNAGYGVYGVWDEPTRWDIIVPTLLMLAVILGLWGLNLLGIAAGVRSALLRRSSGMALSMSLGMMVLLMACGCIGIWVSGSMLLNQPESVLLPVLVFLVLVLMTSPYIMAVLLMRETAQVWHR
ncbi:MAG: hypothetical protein JW966_01485 [Anaerolineae bacterium]|nr:hypothetical protein [Anaerolineae bacterium]